MAAFLRFCVSWFAVLHLATFLLFALVLQRCTGCFSPPPHVCSVAQPARFELAALLPPSISLPRPSGRWVALLDTSRQAGGPAHLARKASPRSQWLPAAPPYLVYPLHRRPRQALLDSLARAARRL